MAGASTHTDDERPTLGKRTKQPTALTVGTTDAGGIDPFTSRPVSVRLPDGPVNALSELRVARPMLAVATNL
jgi:hypothetical protein